MTLRHSDIRLTMDPYGELGEDDLFRELPGKFPVPKKFVQEGRRARDVGRDGLTMMGKELSASMRSVTRPATPQRSILQVLEGLE